MQETHPFASPFGLGSMLEEMAGQQPSTGNPKQSRPKPKPDDVLEHVWERLEGTSHLNALVAEQQRAIDVLTAEKRHAESRWKEVHH